MSGYTADQVKCRTGHLDHSEYMELELLFFFLAVGLKGQKVIDSQGVTGASVNGVEEGNPDADADGIFRAFGRCRSIFSAICRCR